MYTSSARAKSENPAPRVGAPAPNERHAKNAPIAKRAMWIARNPIGGIWLTKSPNGMPSASFLPDQPALGADPVGDDAGEGEGQPGDDDEMGKVLPERERPDELVVDRVEDGVGDEIEEQPRGDHRGAGLREARHRLAAGGRVEELGEGATVVHGRLLGSAVYN